jgi:Zn-dependent peptidase ImmA (M78 family)
MKLLPILLLIAGCTSNAPDYITEGGIAVKMGNINASADMIDRTFIEAMACTGSQKVKSRPMIIFVDHYIFDKQAITMFHTKEIMFHIPAHETDFNIRWLLRHEFTHFFLSERGFSDIKNMGHKYDYFGKCETYNGAE